MVEGRRQEAFDGKLERPRRPLKKRPRKSAPPALLCRGMSSAPTFPEIHRHELIARLGTGPGICVVTPNQRLSGALAEAFAMGQAARGLVAWEAPDILPMGAFIERLYQDGLYSEIAPAVPLLLSPIQEQAIWEAVITGSEAGVGLLSTTNAATLARDAWTLAHAWRLLPSLRDFFGNEDTRVFADWAWRYEGLTARDRQTERARLPEVLTSHLGAPAVRKPSMLVAFGFDIFTPQQQAFLAALGSTGVEIWRGVPDVREADARRLALPSARDEIWAAANWARARLEAASMRGERQCTIGIVVPDLARCRNAVDRAFAQVLTPAHGLPGAEPVSPPFNISLGSPLAAYPLASAALLILELGYGDIEFDAASRLLRSPFIAGGEGEFAARACLDTVLRRGCAPRTTLERVRRALVRHTAPDNPYRVRPCPRLLQCLTALGTYARENLSGSRRPGEWARAVLELWDACGFPGDRALDSGEYQTLQKLYETVAAFAALDRVAGRMRFSQARARLARTIGEVVFQPEARTVPIQILGVLESAGMAFDHLWVMGLSDAVWPMPARPNPFVPVALQKRAGVPEASAAASLELDRRITQGWLTAAGEVVLSHPLREDDRELPMSPLIQDLNSSDAGVMVAPDYATARSVIHASAKLARIDDGAAPALPAGIASEGGTGVFRDQAACPFRAFAIHRLGARGLEAASDLNASDRGTLVHSLLAKIWREIKSSATLNVLSERDLLALIAAAAEAAIGSLRWRRPEALSGRLAGLERDRLVRLACEWLATEKQRPAFEIAAIETKQAISFGGLTVNARLDRMDRLMPGTGADAQAGWAVLDYKTGRAEPGAWLGERPDEPQLPLYAVGNAVGGGAPAGVVALAFARVSAGNMAFRGIGREQSLIPGVDIIEKQRAKAARLYQNWDEVLSGFRRELDALGAEFVRGEARVAPKQGAATCRYCELHALCRISEREGFVPVIEENSAPPEMDS
ncbi:MAG: PD-(D/E)XK nuclease family protein [Betaproteobacteria bacterium]|nr:PD-(D/E)XK nuclease family protein [Betaproteobacteria bacterium]